MISYIWETWDCYNETDGYITGLLRVLSMLIHTLPRGPQSTLGDLLLFA